MQKQNNTSGTRREHIALSVIAASVLLAYGGHATASVTSPVIGNLLWSEEFNEPTLDTTLWTAVDGNGCQINLCGYGNQELEYYSPNNVAIVNVPFEPGTRALAITARNQTAGSNVFTSGKIGSQGKVQIQYGMVEIRMATPTVSTGLWPAAWMLGTSPETWPRNGEIDIAEQGHAASVRAAAGTPVPSADNFVGSNVITFQQAACVSGNPTCAASTSWQTKNWYTPAQSLANRFVTYRLYWTDSQIRFTVV
ncbi:MAG TPA: glycoside hydrolase family 16 protein, partial [Burkholderiaceae bacterium]